jgi:glycosyltransferase involved in cell wall biosynthesis
MRVLHVALNLEAGGLERLIVELANRVDPSEFESHVLVLQYPGRHARELDARVAVHVAPPSTRWSMLRPTGLARLMRRIVPDVVHTHSGVWYKASFAARLAGVRATIHTDHGRLLPDPLGDRVTDALAARRTRMVVAVSEPLGAYLERALRIPKHKLHVVQNGVAIGARGARIASRREAVRAELRVASDAALIGTVGRLDPIKGYDVLIDAYRLLRERWADGTPPALMIAGDGPERFRLHARVAALPEPMRRDVHLLGWRTDVGDLLDALDVFTLSSHSEGTSVSLLEAMSAQVCPVVTSVGGNPFVLGDALAHRLVRPNDASALACALCSAVREAPARIRDAERARARVEARFSIEAMVRRYEELYRRAVHTA